MAPADHPPTTPSAAAPDSQAEPTQAAAFSLQTPTHQQLLRVLGSLLGHDAVLMVDSGATNDFLSAAFIQRLGAAAELQPTDRTVRGYDGTPARAAGEIAAALVLHTDKGDLTDTVPARPFIVVQLRGVDAILGRPWLAARNPAIDWATGEIRIRPADQNQNSPATVHRLTPDRQAPPTPGWANSIIEELILQHTGQSLRCPFPSPAALCQAVSSFSPAPSNSDHPALKGLRAAFLKEFANVFPAELPAGLPPDRGMYHRIELKPGSTPPRRGGIRFSRADDEGIAAFVKECLAKGFIKVSQSAYSAMPFQVAKKNTTERRTVVDYRALNAITVPSRYPVPLMTELFDRLQGALYLSKFDLSKGFYQIPIHPDDTHKTAFRTSSGLYEYLVLPMGLCNAPGTFMQLMNETFKEWLNDGVIVFLDDIIVYSKTLEEHQRLIRAVLTRLRERRLYAKESKCSLFQREVEFLGHHVGQGQIRIMEDKLEAVTAWPPPQKVKEVRAFLGLVGFYRRFIRGFSSIALPLTELTKTVTGAPYSWGDRQQRAFDALKLALKTAPILRLADPDRPYVVHTDASGFATGAVLQQDYGTGLQPIAFMSKKMVPAETRYPVHEQELLAIVEALATWRHYLIGPAPFRVLTDHRSLTYFQTQPMLSGRQTRWMVELAAYNFTIEYVTGASNVVADALSRRSDLNTDGAPDEPPPRFVDPPQKTATGAAPTPNAAEACTIHTHHVTDLLGATCFTAEASAEEDQQAELLSVRSADRHQELQRQQDRAKAITAATKCVEPARGQPAPDSSGNIATPTQRCTANNRLGRQCGSRTTKGQYCWNHLRSVDGLRIKASGINGAGLGLFTSRPFKKGEHITSYSGDYAALRGPRDGGAYDLEITKHRAIRAARTNTAPGRWLNDARGNSELTNNTEFVMDRNRGTGRLRATRNIPAGAELLVPYGASYWRYHSDGATRARKTGPRASAAASSSFSTLPEQTGALLFTVAAVCTSPLAELITEACEAAPEWAAELIRKHDADTKISSVNGHLYYDHRLCIPPDDRLRTSLIQECHDTPLAGHLGGAKTLEQLTRRFYWKGMDAEVKQYVLTCVECQKNKPSQQLPGGQLMPLEIPPRAWHTVSMDFITQLPRSRAGNDCIVVFVCKLIKRNIFVACKTAISAPEVAELFLHHVVREHGLPSRIVSDRDVRFTATFWQSFWAKLGTKLAMSTAYHPQTDGQTENANRTLETILRAAVDFRQTNWDTLLPAAEMAVNNAKNATTGYSPFYLDTGRDMQIPLDVATAPLFDVNDNPSATAALERWAAALQTARSSIESAQNRQIRYADLKRRVLTFKIGDKVLLSIKNLSLVGDGRRSKKLTARFVGPYRVSDIINRNAYRLDLPPELKIHPVINVSLLKPYRDGSKLFPYRPDPISRPPPEAVGQQGDLFEVERVVGRRRVRGVTQYHVKWRGYPDEESSWEPSSSLESAAEAIADFNAQSSDS